MLAYDCLLSACLSVLQGLDCVVFVHVQSKVQIRDRAACTQGS
jgi:hypothetical protein